MLEDVVTAVYQPKRLPKQSLSMHVIPQLMLPYQQTLKSFKQAVFLSEQCAMSKVTTNVRTAVFQC